MLEQKNQGTREQKRSDRRSEDTSERIAYAHTFIHRNGHLVIWSPGHLLIHYRSPRPGMRHKLEMGHGADFSQNLRLDGHVSEIHHQLSG
jgi:hypothetical protein